MAVHSNSYSPVNKDPCERRRTDGACRVQESMEAQARAGCMQSSGSEVGVAVRTQAVSVRDNDDNGPRSLPLPAVGTAVTR